MRRATWTFIVLLALASLSWTRASVADPAIDPDADRNQAPPPSATLPRAPLAPSPAESGIESDVWVGDKAPDFELDGSQGQPVRLRDLAGQWAEMVFTENRTTLGPLKGIDADLRKLGVRLYGICKDGSAALKTYAEHERLPFVLLSDLTGQISQLYGMYDAEDGAIQPGIVLIDPQGVVRMTFLGPPLHSDEVLQLARHTVAGL